MTGTKGLQFSVASMLGLVACVAVNIWCFKVHVMLGFVALNVTKHVAIAQLCHALGVNRRAEARKPIGPTIAIAPIDPRPTQP